MGKKKHGFNILAGLFGGFGDAASEYSRLKEKKGDTEEKLLNDLAQLSFKQQLNQLDPYRQALTAQTLAQAARINRGPEPDAFDKKMAVFNSLNPQPSPLTKEQLPVKAGDVQRQQLLQSMFKGGPGEVSSPIPSQEVTVQSLINKGTQEEQQYKKNLASFIGASSTDEQKMLMDVVKELNKTDPMINPDKYAKLLKRVVSIMGPEEALNAGFIDDTDLESGVLEDLD